jgi:hypothetical protein
MASIKEEGLPLKSGTFSLDKYNFGVKTAANIALNNIVDKDFNEMIQEIFQFAIFAD